MPADIGTSWASMMIQSDTALTPEEVSQGVSIVADSLHLLPRIGIAGFVSQNNSHQFTEKTDRVNRSTITAALTATTTTMVCTNDVFENGEWVRINAEICNITAKSGANYTIGRGTGWSTAAAHADNSMVVSMGKPHLHGDTAGTTGNILREATKFTNYPLTLEQIVYISRQVSGLPSYDHAGSHQESAFIQVWRRIMAQLEEAVWSGKASAPSSSAEGRTEGILSRLSTGGRLTAKSGAVLSVDNIEDAIENAMDFGAKVNALYLGRYSKRTMNHLPDSLVKHNLVNNAPNDLTYGQSVSKLYLADAELDIVVRDALFSNAVVLAEDLVRVGPLVNNQFEMREMGRDGQRDRWQLGGSYVTDLPALGTICTGFTGVATS